MFKKTTTGIGMGWVLFFGLLVSSPPESAGQQPANDAERLQVVYGMYAEYQRKFPTVPEMSVQEAMALLGRDEVVFIDTRRPAEWQVSRLPGAVTPEEFSAAAGRYGDKKLVAYCTIGYRSGQLAEELGRQGRKVYNLRGGILAWALEGGTVYDDHGPVKRLHVFGKQWNYAPVGFDTVLFGFWEQLF